MLRSQSEDDCFTDLWSDEDEDGDEIPHEAESTDDCEENSLDQPGQGRLANEKCQHKKSTLRGLV